MIQVIFGQKGTGKTKRIIDMANAELKAAKGSVVFIHINKTYMYELDRDIRFIDASDYKIKGPKMISGFIAGIAAQDFDIEHIFIDGFMQIVGDHPVDTLEEFFKSLDGFSTAQNIKMTVSVSTPDDQAPQYLKQYIVG